MPCQQRMKYRLWNKTTEKWIRNDDQRVCEYEIQEDALRALEQVIDLKQLNPGHEDDQIVIHTFYEE